MSEIDYREYEFMWADENEVYFDLEPMIFNYGKNAIKKFGFGLENALAYNFGFCTEFYMPKKELVRIGEEGYKFFSNKKKLKKFLKEVEISNKTARETIANILKYDLTKLDVNDFIQLWDVYCESIVDIFTCYCLTQPDKIVRLETELNKYVDELNIISKQQAVSILTKSDKTIIINNKKTDLLKSFSETIKKENYKINKDLFREKLYTIKKIVNLEKKDLIKKYKISKKIIKTADTIGILGITRLEMRLNWSVLNYYHELFINEIKNRLKISKEQIRFLSFSEIINILIGKEKLNLKKIQIRSKGVVVILKDGKIIEIEGKKVGEIMKKIKKSSRLATKKITGAIAAKGKTKGRVLVLSYRDAERHSQKIKSMRKGDIIVTEMTHPNIMNACKKAGGIITDEGGLLSHAAIVSRELNIPCVIGTKVATQVLKDGDLVKVDANNGIIKVIK
ncbi:MAG: PEP-utilizing enzyme [Patescibacteria group bacterium]|nr:PEP-utilizing enzyme [Patescibacteria group bacterium]MDD4611303.1 PEP-utilizing enzyme [Patescibacteria group bacterium]